MSPTMCFVEGCNDAAQHRKQVSLRCWILLGALAQQFALAMSLLEGMNRIGIWESGLALHGMCCTCFIKIRMLLLAWLGRDRGVAAL